MQSVTQRENICVGFSPPHAQHINGFAERTLQDCHNRCVALLQASGLGIEYWNLAWQYAVTVRDYIPRAANPQAQSPHHMRTGKDVEASTFLHPFGSTVMAWIPKEDRHGKFAPASRKGIYVGWDRQTKCHRILVTTASGMQLIRLALHVTIDPNLPSGVYDPDQNISVPLYEEAEEEEYDRPWEEVAAELAAAKPKATPELPTSNDFDFDRDFEVLDQEIHVEDGDPQDPQPPSAIDLTMELDMGDASEDESAERVYTSAPGDTIVIDDPAGSGPDQTRVYVARKPRTYVHRLGMILDGNRIEYSLARARKRFPKYSHLFPEAVQIEKQGLESKCLQKTTWDSIKPNEKVSTLLTIYTVKFEHGEFEKCKLRAVYRGEAEKYGVDWITKSTNLPRLSTLRVFIAMSPYQQEIAGRMDVPQAFLLAPVQKIAGRGRVLIQFPGDISSRDEAGRPQLYEVTHSLYGMVAAAYQWEQKLFAFFRKIGLRQCTHDKAIWTAEGITVLAWVDDTPYRATPERARWFKDAMYAEFGDCKNKPLDWCLGIAVVKDPLTGYLGIHQESYIDAMTERFGLQNANPASTPLPSEIKINKGDRCEDIQLSDSLKNEFQQLLGCICYIGCWTQPQIAYAASALGAVASAPGPLHVKYARQVVRYCSANRGLGLKYGPPRPITDPELARKLGREGKTTTHEVDKLIIHSDSSFAQEAKYCSQSSFVVMMNGAPVHWSSVRQAFPALSSSEAEIMAGCHALRTAIHMHALLEDLGKPQGIIDFCFDAENAIKFNSSDKITPRNMHIGVRYWRVRYHVGNEIRLVYVHTTMMTADIGTKSAKADQFIGIVNLMMHDFSYKVKVVQFDLVSDQ